ncbi:MAG: hypothetical protein IKL79_05325 [Clostridia bacterium]|nr:hypothetical protein [Clostridia bacterium]MBR3681405.1 hypothetical protein [Clostridia bacterium]
MKKIICGTEYDTAASTVVKKYTEGYYGDPAGFEETLYVTADGKYFLYTNGGADSKYPTESIKRMGKAKAEEFLAAH